MSALRQSARRARAATEFTAFEVLTGLQRTRSVHRAFAVVPLASVRLRDAGVRSPDFIVVGNGRAVVIEIDVPYHYGATRKADDADRDRRWLRCGVHTVRITVEATRDRAGLSERVRGELGRYLFEVR